MLRGYKPRRAGLGRNFLTLPVVNYYIAQTCKNVECIIFDFMRNLITLSLLLCVSQVFSQTDSTGLLSGNLATEVQFNMTNGWFGNIVVPTIRFRYALTDNFYVRADFDGDFNSSNRTLFENPDGTGKEGTIYTKNNQLRFGLGIEKHVAKFKKLDPYIGGQLGFSKATWVQDFQNARNNRFDSTYSFYQENPSTGANLYLFTGFNFWVYERLYIGTEFGISAEKIWQGEMKSVVTENGIETTNNQGPSTFIRLNKEVNPAIRIGYLLF